MKSIILAAAVLFTWLPMAAQTNTDVVHQDGLFAQALAFSGGTSIDLNVSRGTDASGQTETFLFFDSFQQTADGFTDTFASGQIPDGSLQGDDPARVLLDVDTSQLTNFISSSCTFSFITFTETCGPAPAGLIHLQWRQIRATTTHTNLDMQQNFFQFRITTHQVSDTASAALSGSIFGLDPSSGGGEIGVNHGSSIEIDRFPRH
jgi:hypothetical protein